MKTLFFTATGNNLYLARRIGAEYYSIPKCLKESRFDFEDDKIGVVFPVYMIKVPGIIEEFLGKVKIRSPYIFSVLSYGFYSGAASSQLFEIGRRNSIHFSYINEIKMVDNYLPNFDMAEQILKEPQKNIEGNLEKIIRDIESRREYIKKASPATKLASRLISNVYLPNQDKRLFDYPIDFDKNYLVEDGCNGCGICVKVCPVTNIKLENKRPVYQGNCIRCMACIHHCSQTAIHLKSERSKVRFINKNVKLAEIIKANS